MIYQTRNLFVDLTDQDPSGILVTSPVCPIRDMPPTEHRICQLILRGMFLVLLVACLEWEKLVN
jgi:hypothetical protein